MRLIIVTYNLAGTSQTTRDDLSRQGDLAILALKGTSGQIVDGKLDSLLRRHTDELRQHARVQSAETLVSNNLLEAVDRVLVQALSGLGASLVLESRLDQVDGVHHEGTKSTSQTSESEVVGRLEDTLENMSTSCGSRLGRGGLDGVVYRVAPRGIQHLGEVTQAQTTRGVVEAGEVEEDVGLHWCEEGESCDLGCLVEELAPGNLAVLLALGHRAAHYQLDQIHFLNHVLESTNVGIRDLGSLGDVAQGVEVLEQVVRQLMLGRLENDALEVLGVDVTVAILVEELEGLPDALALQTTQHLGELRVVEVVSLLPATDVQLGPLTVPVEGDVVRALVQLIELSEVVILDITGAVDIEQAKGDLVLGVWLRKQVLEDNPIGKVDPAAVLPIGDAKQDRVLVALDLVLFGAKNRALVSFFLFLGLSRSRHSEQGHEL